MRVDRLTLKDFTVFHKADFEFSPGLNVLIGANGTGKSHALKILYSALRPLAFALTAPEAGKPVFGKDSRQVWDKLFAVFRPQPASFNSGFDSGFAHGGLHSLARHGADALNIDTSGDFGKITLGIRDRAIPWWSSEANAPKGMAVFVPPTEVLSMFRGFVAAYERKELSFDETFRDLCVDLSATPLRSVSPPVLADLLAALDRAVGGGTVLRGDRFYVSLSDDWLLEAPMLAEGLRKLASIAYLIRNGSLTEKSVLFWDEPETNINPKLMPTVARTLMALAGAGIQVFAATHDFLLSNELSLTAEYETADATKAKPRFFALSKPGPLSPVEVESGNTLADLRHNPILEEFAAYHDRERDLFYGNPAKTEG